MHEHLSASFASEEDQEEQATTDVLKSLVEAEAAGPAARRGSWTTELVPLAPASPRSHGSGGSPSRGAVGDASDGDDVGASGDEAPPVVDDEVEEIIRESVNPTGISRLLPECDRAALIERLRTDLFQAQKGSEAHGGFSDDGLEAVPSLPQFVVVVVPGPGGAGLGAQGPDLGAKDLGLGLLRPDDAL